MFRVKLAMMFGGIALMVFGYQEWKLASAASATPQTISCKELSEKGPGKNAHVTMTDYLICDQGFVYEAKSKTDTETWSKVWVPVVPKDGEYVRKLVELFAKAGPEAKVPMPTDIRVIVKSAKVSNKNEIAALQADALTGLITNKIDSLGSEEKKFLSESYPGIDFTKCYIFDHERKPAGTSKIAGLLGGGTALLLLGAYLTFGGGKKSRSTAIESKPVATTELEPAE